MQIKETVPGFIEETAIAAMIAAGCQIQKLSNGVWTWAFMPKGTTQTLVPYGATLGINESRGYYWIGFPNGTRVRAGVCTVRQADARGTYNEIDQLCMA